MGFQSTIYPAMGFGVPGDLYNESPIRSRSYILNSASAAYNIVGSTCCTLSAEGVAQAGGTGIFVGFLVNSKVYASFGTSAGGPLAPTLTLANYTQAEFLTMGSVVALLPTSANIGDLVIFDNTTGAISTIAPGASLPSGKTFAQAVVQFYDISSNGIGVITFTDTLITPQPAFLTNQESNKKVASVSVTEAQVAPIVETETTLADTQAIEKTKKGAK